MKKSILFLIHLVITHVNAQEPILTVGSKFPELTIAQISNAPVKQFYLNKVNNNKLYIINFWGTWCSPCIPEMDSLAKLQAQNQGKIQVIAISDDSDERKAQYLKNKPSSIWLATDTAYTLYKMLNLASVGQSAIIGPDKKIIAVVKTDSINQQLINKLLKGNEVKMSASLKEAVTPTNSDPFGVDSLMDHSFSLRGYKKGVESMEKLYYDDGIYNGRRASWFNVTAGLLYRTAFGIKSYNKQEFYDSSVKAKEVNLHSLENRELLYCLDLLVKPSQKDSLYIIMQQYLNKNLPIKARLEKQKIDVYILTKKQGATITIPTASATEKMSFGFSGKGFEGSKVSLTSFADYLSNELALPVVDETGLLGYYNIKTNVEQRNDQGILKSIESLGFTVEKAKREMPVITYYK